MGSKTEIETLKDTVEKWVKETLHFRRENAALTKKVEELEKISKQEDKGFWDLKKCLDKRVDEVTRLNVENKNKQKLIDGYYERWQSEKAEKERLEEALNGAHIANQLLVEGIDSYKAEIAAIREGVEKLPIIFNAEEEIDTVSRGKVLALPELKGGKK